MSYKKVSVIIPVYNSVDSIKRAINSVLWTEEVGEIILVDDGSQDGSFQLCREFERNYEKVKLFTHPNHGNLGASASRNLGLKNSKYDWIQFLDSDDELLPPKIKVQIELTRPDLSFIVGSSILINGKRTKKRKFKKDIWTGLFSSKLGHTSSNLWNKNFLDKIGGWHENISSSQEYDLMFRLLKINSKIAFDEAYNTIVYRTPDSISTSKTLQMERTKNWMGLRIGIREHLKKNNEFSIVRNYHYSGVLGTHFKENNLNFNGKFNIYLYYLYRTEKWVKVFTYDLLQQLKSKVQVTD